MLTAVGISGQLAFDGQCLIEVSAADAARRYTAAVCLVNAASTSTAIPATRHPVARAPVRRNPIRPSSSASMSGRVVTENPSIGRIPTLRIAATIPAPRP